MNIQQQIEALIFISGDEGISLHQVMDVLEISEDRALETLQQIKEFHQNSQSSLSLVDYGQKYHFVTKKETFDVISRFLNLSKAKQLSQSSLETLAIIAYKQPITRLEIEEIRGVSCDIILRKLQSLDLITETGRLETPGRPILYGVSNNFLDVFKMVSLSELPEINFETKENEELF